MSAEAHDARRERTAHQERAVACGGGGRLLIKGSLRGGPPSKGRADLSDHRMQARACGHSAHIGCKPVRVGAPPMVPARVLEGTRYSPKTLQPGCQPSSSPLAPMAASAVPSAVIGEGSFGQAGLGLMCAPVRACVCSKPLDRPLQHSPLSFACAVV